MKLFTKFNSFKKKIAIVQDDKSYKYNDLISYSKKFSRLIKKNSLIVLIARNEIESISFYISCIINGYFLIILDESSDIDFFFKSN